MRCNLFPHRNIQINARVKGCNVFRDGWRFSSSDQSIISGSNLLRSVPVIIYECVCVCVCVWACNTSSSFTKGVMWASGQRPLARGATNQCQRRNFGVELQGLDFRVGRAILALTQRGRSSIAAKTISLFSPHLSCMPVSVNPFLRKTL